MSVLVSRTAGPATDLRDTVLVGSLEIDRAPVTNKRYDRFVAQTGHRPPLYWPQGKCPRSLEDHPVVGVDFFDALAFAFWAGGSLPTEEEWIAATGLEGASGYVWGDCFEAHRCNTMRSGVKGTTPVGAYPEGTAPSGCVDMCGNVWEMTCTGFEEECDSVIVKGGSWYDFPAHARISTRFRARVNKGGNTVGFRLVYGRPLELPEFLDPGLVAECIAFRHGDAPYVDDEGEEGGEFDAIVSALRETAKATLPDLEESDGPTPEAVQEALAILDGPGVVIELQDLDEDDDDEEYDDDEECDDDEEEDPPATPPFRRRLGRACRLVAGATAWRRILPTLKACLRCGLERSVRDRLKAAWTEIRRPLPGLSLLAALGAACDALRSAPRRRARASGLGARLREAWAEFRLPEGTPSLRRRLRLAWLEVTRLRAVRPFRDRLSSGIEILRRPEEVPTLYERVEAAFDALSAREGPSLRERFLTAIRDRPTTLFIVLCLAVGVVAGVLGAASKQPAKPNRIELSRVAVEDTRAAPPPAARVVARRAERPEEEEPAAAPPVARQPRATVAGAISAILTGDAAARAEGELFLIWHADEATQPVRDALRARLAPDARASLLYVLAAIEEGRSKQREMPVVVPAPPRQGLVLFSDNLEGSVVEQIAAVRRTAKAHRIEFTLVLSGGPQVERTARENATDLGAIRLYVDYDGAYTRRMRVTRLPAVAGLRPDGRLGFLLLGEVRRERLAPNVARLVQ